MKIAYQRKSEHTYEELIERVPEALKKIGWELKGETKLKNGSVFYISNRDVLEDLLDSHPELLGFIPSTLLVSKGKKECFVTVQDSGLIRDLTSSHNHGHEKVVNKLIGQIKELVHTVAEVSEMKVSKVTLFSTATCPYCTMEKNWLEENGVEHQVVYVDKDQEMARYMVERTGQMGVPVTEVKYEDDQADYVVGFDRKNLASMLSIND